MVIRKVLVKTLLIVLLFIYIYSLIFQALPINTKIILEALGLFCSLFFIINKRFRLKNKYKWVINFALVIIAWDFIVSFINGTSEFYLAKAMVTPIGSIFGAQLIYLCVRKTVNTTEQFFYFVALTVFIQCILCLGVHFIPGADGLYTSIFIPSGGAADLVDIAGHYRLVGIGNAVAFGALPSFVIGIFGVVYLIATYRNTLSVLMAFIMYATIILVTFLIVRTSVIVSLLSILSLVFLTKKKKTFILGGIALAVFTILAVHLISKYIDPGMFEWAFGFFISKDVDSGTQGRVLEWYQTIHFDISTFLMGDGVYENPNGGYYGDTDVGFFRQIFYGGIIGLTLMIYYHYRILKYIYICRPEPQIKTVVSLLFISYIVFLAKGDLNLLSGFLLILVFLDEGIFEKKPNYSSIVNSNQIKNESSVFI